MTRRGFFAKFTGLAAAIGISPVVAKAVAGNKLRNEVLWARVGSGSPTLMAEIAAYKAKQAVWLAELEKTIRDRVEEGRLRNLTNFDTMQELDKVWSDTLSA